MLLLFVAKVERFLVCASLVLDSCKTCPCCKPPQSVEVEKLHILIRHQIVIYHLIAVVLGLSQCPLSISWHDLFHRQDVVVISAYQIRTFV